MNFIASSYCRPNPSRRRGVSSEPLVSRGQRGPEQRSPWRGGLFAVAATIGCAVSSTSAMGQGLSVKGIASIPQRLEEKAPVSFEKQVAGILNSRCGQCHVQGSKGRFRMSTFAELMRAQGVVTPGNPAQSKLVSLIESGEMPPKGSMPQEELGVIKRWVEQGAKFDGPNENANLATLAGASDNPTTGGPPPGYSGGPPPGYSGGPPPGYSSGGPPGYSSGPTTSSGGPPPGYSGGPPPGYSGGPPPGYGSGGPPGYSSGPTTSSGGPPPGYSGGPPPGYSGGPPPGYSGGPPAGYGGTDSYEMEMEMGMEDPNEGMEDYYGGYGGRPSGFGRAGTAQGDALDTYASSLTSMVGALDLSGLFLPQQEVVVESGPVLKREADQAFQAGHQAMALQLMFGHMAAEYDEALMSIQGVKYSPILKRPVWNIRWGISMFVRGDSVSDPKPIREGATPSRRVAGRGGRGQPYGGAMAGQDYAEMMESEMDMDMGMEMEMEEEMNMEDDFGSDYEMQMRGQMMGRGGPGMRGPGMRGRGGPTSREPEIPERRMLSEEVRESLDKHLGLVAEIIQEEFNKRFQRGDFGPLFTSLAPVEVATERAPRSAVPATAPAPTAQGRMSAALNEALLELGEPAQPMWQPGLVFLGEGTSDEMLAAAETSGLDLLLHFDVILKEGRNEEVQNISRCRLFNVSPPTDSRGNVRHLVVTSKGMDSYEAQQFAGAGRMDEREYVTEQLSNLLEIIDRDVKVVDLPSFSAEVAQKRLSTIMSGPSARSLRTLAEIRLYQARNLLDEAQLEAAFEITAGSDGLMLLYGPKDQKIEAVRRWATEAAAQR